MKKKVIISALSALLLALLIAIVVNRNQLIKVFGNHESNTEQTSDDSFPQSQNNKTNTEASKTQEQTSKGVSKPVSSQTKQSVQKTFEKVKKNGFNGNEKDWLTDETVKKKNLSGLSVYQIAQEHGFEGTQEEWVDQLLQPIAPESNNQVTDASVTDDGHLIVIFEDVTIETVDVVKPIEPEKASYTVTFLDKNNAVLKVQQVYQDEFATPPLMEDADFLGWQGKYADVQHNETVKAVYADSKNVFRISSVQGKPGDTVSMMVQLDGDVLLCGLDMIIRYAPSLELISVNDELDMDVVVNADDAERSIRFNFSSAMNKKRPMEMMELTFKIADVNAKTGAVTLSAGAVKVLDDNLVTNAVYTIINGVVFVDE